MRSSAQPGFRCVTFAGPVLDGVGVAAGLGLPEAPGVAGAGLALSEAPGVTGAGLVPPVQPSRPTANTADALATRWHRRR